MSASRFWGKGGAEARVKEGCSEEWHSRWVWISGNWGTGSPRRKQEERDTDDTFGGATGSSKSAWHRAKPVGSPAETCPSLSGASPRPALARGRQFAVQTLSAGPCLAPRGNSPLDLKKHSSSDRRSPLGLGVQVYGERTGLKRTRLTHAHPSSRSRRALTAQEGFL